MEGKAVSSQETDTTKQKQWWEEIFNEYNQALTRLPQDPTNKRLVLMNGFNRGMVVAQLTSIYAYTVTNYPVSFSF